MVSSYTSNKSIEKPAYNDYAGNPTGWSGPINDDWDAIDAAFGGRLALNATGSVGTVNLTITQTRNLIITITGAMTGNAVYTLPQNTAATAVVGGQWIVYNNTTGSFTVTISPVSGGGTSVVCQQGYVTSIYCDGTNIDKTNTVPIANNSVTNAMLATVATQIIKGRATAGTGNVEDLTLTQILDFLSSTQGAVLYRGASAWAGLAPGTSGQYLTTNGAAANPSWTTAPSVLPSQTGNSGKLLTTDGSTPSWSSDSTVRARGTLNTATNTWSTGVVNFSASVVNTTGGTFVFSFSSALASANYQVLFTSSTLSGFASGAGGAVSNKTTTGFQLSTFNTATGGALEPDSFDLVVYGGF
jgi:hypothetical protein